MSATIIFGGAVSNDSGLMHLAAAGGTPTLGLRAHFIHEAARVEPAGRAAGWVLRPGDDMRVITVDEVWDGCRHVLVLGAEKLGTASAPSASPSARSSKPRHPGLDPESSARTRPQADPSGHALRCCEVEHDGPPSAGHLALDPESSSG